MPNIEIEYKYRIDDPDKMIDKIIGLGAKFEKQSRAVDTYFLVPDNIEGRKYLRVREGDGKSILAYHYVVANDLTKEWEIEVSDAKIAREVLVNIGHSLDVVVDKSRKKYYLYNSEIVVDIVARLGNFVEIESKTKEELLEIEKKLGFIESDRIIDCGYPDMIKKLNSK